MELNKRAKMTCFDNMELLQCKSFFHDFPLHYHNTFCLTIVHDGIMGENDVFASAGTLLISHPFEIHQNKLINQTAYSFTTFYLSPDLFSTAAQSKKLFFKEKVIYNDSLARSFNQLARHLFHFKNSRKSIAGYEKKFMSTLGQLAQAHSCDEPFVETIIPKIIYEIKDYIKDHLHRKISLIELSHIAGMDKFKFLRWFKKHTGLTPFNFIILNRVEMAKKMLKEGKPLIQAALDSGFYDQSHFTNYFKYFVGITPKEYKNSFNIFQDFS
ncbi:MAG: AraC family transcriptional regulator [Pedobacter agri]